MTAAPSTRKVGVVLFDGLTVLDVYGPVQAFASCRVQKADGTRQPLFELFSMAERVGIVRPVEGPLSYAEYGFADAPDYDILLVLGGSRTGLLDGRPTTSNKLAWNWVVQQGPRVKWKRQARWVDDGDIVTSSGVSAGIDMALSLIARLHGRDTALASARNMEYRWHEDAADDPFA